MLNLLQEEYWISPQRSAEGHQQRSAEGHSISYLCGNLPG